MVWVRNIVTNPTSGQSVLEFKVRTSDVPHRGFVGILAIAASSEGNTTLTLIRLNDAETKTKTFWELHLTARQPVIVKTPQTDDPLEPNIGLPEAGTYEKVRVINKTAFTGNLFVAVEVIGGPIDLVTGDVW